MLKASHPRKLCFLLALGCGSQSAPLSVQDASLEDHSNSSFDVSQEDHFSEPEEASFVDAPSAQDAAQDVTSDVTQDVALTHECELSQASYCLNASQIQKCVDTPLGRRFETQSCPSGSGCLNGNCAPNACSDECTIGEKENGKTCVVKALPNTTGSLPYNPQNRMHDKARNYQEWLRKDFLSFGGVGSAHYSDPGTYEHVDMYDGLGDSAIWTGTYVASEAFRLAATGSSDARRHLIEGLKTLHLWFRVTGQPGLLARYVTPHGVPWKNRYNETVYLRDLSCDPNSFRQHCNVLYNNQAYDFIGDISRDQYQGVMLAYAAAYEALAGQGLEAEAMREEIRKDVVAFVKELMIERVQPALLKVHFNPIQILGSTLDHITLNTNVTMKYVVLAPSEMENGKLVIDLYTQNQGSGSLMRGFQEFMPNLGMILKNANLPSWGQYLKQVPIPRADSAVMLPSFFQVAMNVTRDIPSYSADYQAIQAFYEANVGPEFPGGGGEKWLDYALTWIKGGKCGASYFGYNIYMTPMYNLVRYENDPLRKLTVRNALLDLRVWPALDSHKNSWFSYIYASSKQSPSASLLSTAEAQLSQFPLAPRVKRGVDLRNNPSYPVDSECPNQLVKTDALDIAVRPVGDFIWQRNPWELYDWEDLHQTQPGVDYLAAYWLGRKHAFLQEDAPGVCAQWE